MEPFPFHVQPSYARRPFCGFLLTSLGLVICWYGLWGLIVVFAVSLQFLIVWPLFLLAGHQEATGMLASPPFLHWVVLALPSLVVPLFGPELIERGRRMRAKDGMQVLTKDQRAPVIYLRSFQDEDLIDPTLPSIFSIYVLRFRPPFVRNRYEATVTRTLWRIGPVICLGRPGEIYPEIGGARLYVSDGDWQTAIKYFLSRVAAVVFTVGRTESLWWEIQETLKSVPLDRVLFFFPYADIPRYRQSIFRKYWTFIGLGLLTKKMFRRMKHEREERYRLFCQKVQSSLSFSLPLELGTALFVDFSPEGRPRLLETKRPLDKAIMWYFFEYSWTQVSLRRTLKEFLKKVQG